MAYRHKVVRCTAFGKCYSGAEEWSTGFYMGYPDSDALPVAQEAADYFLTHWQTFFTNSATGVSSRYVTDGVRVALLNTDGKTDLNNNHYAYATTPFAGTGGAQNIHPQLTLVASLQARPDRGLGAKGRMFLPGIAHSIGTNAKLSALDTAKVVTSLKTLFDAMNASAAIGGNVINASRGRNLGAFGDMPVNRNIEDILVGDVYDTQRRRRNQLQETYSAGTVTLS